MIKAQYHKLDKDLKELWNIKQDLKGGYHWKLWSDVQYCIERLDRYVNERSEASESAKSDKGSE